MSKRFITASLLILALMACNDEKTNRNEDASITTGAKLDSILHNYYEDGLRLDPVSATTSGDMRYNDRYVNNLSESYQDSLRAFLTTYRDAVSQLDDENLDENERLSKEILLWETNINLEALEFDKEKYMPIDQMWSANLFFGQLASGASSQPFKTVEDYRNWMKRVDGYLTWFNAAQENMREGMDNGYVLPSSIIVKIIPQMEAMTGDSAEEHLFYGPVNNFPESFTAEEKEQLTKEYTQMIEQKVIPAYQKMHDFLKNEYLPKGRKSSGIADIPNGEEFYKHQIKLYTTTDMTAEEIHQLGLDEVARISAEMEKVKEQVGYKGDLKSFFEHVRNNKDLMPFKSAEEVVANCKLPLIRTA